MFIEIISASLVTIGIVLILGLTPESVSQDVLRILHKEHSLKYRVAIAQGKAKKSKIRSALLDIYNALKSTRAENKFTLFCVLAGGGIVAGCFITAVSGNPIFFPVFSFFGIAVPYFYVKAIVAGYNKKVAEELTTALSIITTSYVTNEDIVYSVEDCIRHIKPPVQDIFKEFLGKTKLISSNTKLAIAEMRDSVNNEIFREWCENLIACQDNVTLKLTLQPLSNRLADVRIVNAELETMLMRPRREFYGMVALLPCSIALISFIKWEWASFLFVTKIGQAALGIAAIVVLITIILAHKYTQPIEFKPKD